MSKSILLAMTLSLPLATPVLMAAPAIGPNASILSGLKVVSNFASSDTRFGFNLYNSPADPPLYINSIDFIPGAGYDANIALASPGSVFSTNRGAYTLGTAIDPDTAFWLYNAVQRSGAVDAAVANGIYDFNLEIKGGDNPSATDVLGEIPYQIRIADGVNVSITAVTATPSTIHAGQTATVGLTVTNSDLVETFVTTTWYYLNGGMEQGPNHLENGQFVGNWFDQSIAPGGSLTDGHTTWDATAGTPLGDYSPSLGISGGLYNGDDFALAAPGDPLLTVVEYTSSCVSGFSIDSFSPVSQVSAVRDAHIAPTEGVLRLTDAQESQAGAAWYLDKVHALPGFTTQFTFMISSGVADGFAFVIQDESLLAIGAGGSGLGYSMGVQPGGDLLYMTRSLAVEFDTFGFGGEFPAPHISVQTQGAGINSSDDMASLAHADIPSSITDGQPHDVTVTYVPGSLQVYLDGTLYIDVALDLQNLNGDNILDDNGCAWIGFTGGTGAATANQDILSWKLGNGCLDSLNAESFPPGSMLTIGNAATTETNVLSLTPDLSGQAGAAWFPGQAHLANGFDTSFTFEISAGGGIGDGMAFVIQDQGEAALGSGGSGLGYGDNDVAGISRSLAVELDTFSFGLPSEFDAPHVSIQTNGVDQNSPLDLFSLGHVGIPDFVNAGPHVARVTYVPGVMNIYFDNQLYLVANVDLQNIEGSTSGFGSILDGNGCAWIGFTGGTGGASSEHDVLDWSFTQNTCTSPLSVSANLDGDCDVDAQDLAILQACQSGPAVPYNPLSLPANCPLMPDTTGHISADLDHDSDVDQVDFGILQRCYTGANTAADPNC